MINKQTTSQDRVFFPINRDYLLLKRETEKCLNVNDFSNGFHYQEYLINTTNEEQVTIPVAQEEGFFFIYNWKGNISLRLNKTSHQISPYQSAIFFNKNVCEIDLNLEKQSKNQFCLISFNKPKRNEHASKNLFYNKFKEAFLSQVTDANYICIGQPYLKLLEKINSLSRMSKDTWASELIMQGLILQVMGLKMEQMLELFSIGQRDYCSLTQSEIKRLHTISDFIKENPALEYSVDFLCREAGLSPSKLQEGFRNIHGRTVIDFIRHIRLEKSLELIKTTDLTISEIVYSIGLTSRSYFSKIFKNKYKCSPKHFQERRKFAV